MNDIPSVASAPPPAGLAELFEPRSAALTAPAIAFLLQRLGGAAVTPFAAEALA